MKKQVIKIEKIKLNKIRCPYCGYEMPIKYIENAYAEGVFVRCKGRNCKKEFEIRINNKQLK